MTLSQPRLRGVKTEFIIKTIIKNDEVKTNPMLTIEFEN